MNNLLFVVFTFYYHRSSQTPIVDDLLFRCHNLAFHFFFRPPSHCSVQRGRSTFRTLASPSTKYDYRCACVIICSILDIMKGSLVAH